MAKAEQGGSGQTYDKPQTASSNSKHEPAARAFHWQTRSSQHQQGDTNRGQGEAAGRRRRRSEQGAACSDSVDGQNKGVSRTSFTSSFGIAALPGAAHAKPLARLANVSIIASKGAGVGQEGSRNAGGVG